MKPREYQSFVGNAAREMYPDRVKECASGRMSDASALLHEEVEIEGIGEFSWGVKAKGTFPEGVTDIDELVDCPDCKVTMYLRRKEKTHFLYVEFDSRGPKNNINFCPDEGKSVEDNVIALLNMKPNACDF